MTKCKYRKSCNRILTIEHLITPKIDCEIDVCLECLIAVFEEVLKEKHVLL